MERGQAKVATPRMRILACDLGGTRMKIGVVRDGDVLAQTVEPANAKQGLGRNYPCSRTRGLFFTWRSGLGCFHLSVS